MLCVGGGHARDQHDGTGCFRHASGSKRVLMPILPESLSHALLSICFFQLSNSLLIHSYCADVDAPPASC